MPRSKERCSVLQFFLYLALSIQALENSTKQLICTAAVRRLPETPQNGVVPYSDWDI